MLDKIEEALKKFIAENDYEAVHYGKITQEESKWNYIVFGRAGMKPSGTSGCDFNRYYRVVLVHEGHIPEDDEVRLIKALNKVTGLKMAKSDIDYDYTNRKNGTVVELAAITFSEARKGYLTR